MGTNSAFVPRGAGLVTALLLALLLPPPAPAAAQASGSITGRVVDAASLRPLAGALLTAGTSDRGTAAGPDGRYLIPGIPVGEVTVRVQIIGYEAAERTVTVTANQPVTVDFSLESRALALNEVVVTGVGQATERRQLSTNVSVLSQQEIAEAPVQSLDQLLQGRVAGTTVSAVSGQPGTGSLINFRGVSSVFGAQTPVIYVDGVRVDNSQSTAGGTGGEQSSALSELLTSDIARIEVTRGGPASTLFGSDAATGVIQIFTKRGSPGAPRFTARIEQGIDTPELKYILDAGKIYPDLVEAGEVEADFVARNFFRNGSNQSYSLGVSGGSADVTYNVSGRLQQGEGIQPRNGSTLYNLRGGLDASVGERARISFSGSYNRSGFERIYNGTAIADPITALEVGDALFFSGTDNLDEALRVFLLPEIDETVDRFNFAAGFQFEASESLDFRVTLGADHRGSEQTQFEPIGSTAGEPTGQLFRRTRDFTSVTVDAAGTLRTPLTSWARNTLSVGAQGFRDNTYVLFGNGRTFALPGSKDFSEAATVTAGEGRSQVFTGGVFVDENLALFDRYFLNAGVRLDAGTSFGDDVDYATYPKLGLAWDVSAEPALAGLFEGPIVSSFRFRSAYGATGKFPPPFLRDRTFDAVSFRGESAPRFDNPGNEDLKPEVTRTWEVGFETALWDNRIGLDFTYYDARTEDALFFVPEPPVTGQGTQIRNVGEISNTGIEVDLNVQLLNRPRLAWSVGATYQTVDNVVESMGGAADFFLSAQKRVSQGKQVGAWYVTTPIDTNGDGLNDGSELQFTGKGPTPTQSGSFSTRVTLFQSLTLSAMADWAGGHQVMDFGSVWATFNGIFRREIVEEGYEFPRRFNTAGTELGTYSQSAARSAFIYDGDWWKLREITARYSLPGRILDSVGVQSGTVFGSVRNVYVSSDSPLVDPELAGLVGGGLQLGAETSITVSPPRSFRFGLEFVF